VTTSTKDLVLIAEVVKSHGIRGEVSVVYHGDSPFLLDELPILYLQPKAALASALAKGKSDKVAPGKSDKAAPKGGPKGTADKGVAKAAAPSPRPVKIVSWRSHKDRLLVTFEGIADRDAADGLRGAKLLVREADLPEPSEDELYLYALEGLAVLLEDGSILGHIREVQLLPAGQELWCIDTEDGKEVLFPVAQEFVAAVDLDAGQVIIAPPPGLLELYLTDDSVK